MASNRTVVVGSVTVVTILVILAGAWVALWLKTSATYARIDDIDAHFNKIQGSLDEIRNDLAQSSVHAIECKTDPAACKAIIPSKISNSRDSSTRHLQELESPLQGPERARVTRLRADERLLEFTRRLLLERAPNRPAPKTQFGCYPSQASGRLRLISCD